MRLLLTLIALLLVSPAYGQRVFRASAVDLEQDSRLDVLEQQVSSIHDAITSLAETQSMLAKLQMTPPAAAQEPATAPEPDPEPEYQTIAESNAPDLPKPFRQTLTSVAVEPAVTSVQYVSQPVSQPISYQQPAVNYQQQQPTVSYAAQRSVQRSSGCANGQCSQRSSRSGRGLFGWR